MNIREFESLALAVVLSVVTGGVSFAAVQDGTPLSTKAEKVYTGQNMEKDAKIGISQARSIAIKAQPGRITDEELEKEEGGSGLRYSFDIRTDGVVHEVGVDAATGAVLENSVEGANHD